MKVVTQKSQVAKKNTGPNTATTAVRTRASASPSTKNELSGQSVGDWVVMTGVVYTREITQIRHCFFDSDLAIDNNIDLD